MEKRTGYSTENTKTESTENQLNNVENVERIEVVDKVDISVSKDSIENKNDSKSSIENTTETTSGNNKLNGLSIMQKQELKEYISSVYEVKENNITIN